MKEKKQKKNYLDRIPVHSDKIGWQKEDGEKISLLIENKGVFNRLFQKFFKKPKVSYIHLDEMGSFIWLLIDGEKNVYEISEAVKERFGDDCEPLYERLIKYLEMLSGCGFIIWKNEK